MATRRVPLVDIGNIHGLQFHNSRLFEKAKTVPYQPRNSPRVESGRRLCQLQVVDYAPEIMENLKLSEPKFMPSASYMGRQEDINEKMRAILMDWLVDVHLKFKLAPETLYLSASLTDRFLDQKVVTRSKLQLVGVVAMMLAAKYEEIFPPEIRDFIYISANTYSKDDILKMERMMLASVDFNLTGPTMYQFLKRILQLTEADERLQHMALYISELAMMDYKLLMFPPSMVAAGCVFLARKTLNYIDPWTRVLEHHAGHSQLDLQPVVVQLQEQLKAVPQSRCQAARKKYSHPRFSRAADLAEAPAPYC